MKKIEGRYHRQEILEGWNQEKINQSTVLLAGVGALGSLVAVSLALMGVGKLILVDFDTIELSNLNRQLLFTESDVGEFKARVAAEKLREMNPSIYVVDRNESLISVPRKYYEESDVIVDGLDTFEARRWLNSVCVSLNKPLVHGGMYGWYGNIQVIIPNVTPCLECQPLLPRERFQKSCTPPGKKREKVEKLTFPGISTISAVLSGIQAQETLKILLNLKPTIDNYLFYDGLSQSFTTIKLERNPKCIICSDKYRLEGIEYAIDKRETIKELKDRLIVTLGLVEPIRVIHRTKFIEDNIKIGDTGLSSGELLFVYDKSLGKPLKLRAKIS
ncbi:MAG: HesA/MoeB/ThiF family protein [Candidatus Jordarchaeum sp.]|uniref:HesA/MoeB/ThiF family protein n=1 Tax=Candidatus Jordarchaeum sp. TaxID=2823881 RepID=UPI00404B8DC7